MNVTDQADVFVNVNENGAEAPLRRVEDLVVAEPSTDAESEVIEPSTLGDPAAESSTDSGNHIQGSPKFVEIQLQQQGRDSAAEPSTGNGRQERLPANRASILPRKVQD